MSFFSSSEPDRKQRLRLLLLLLGGAVGVILLLLGGELTQSKSSAPSPEPEPQATDTERYRTELEARIKTLCEAVRGVSHVTVAVTLESGPERVYATEETGGKQTYATVGSGASSSALLLTEREPPIAGIGVVCAGGGNADVRRELISLLSATFNVPGNHIYVTESGA